MGHWKEKIERGGSRWREQDLDQDTRGTGQLGGKTLNGPRVRVSVFAGNTFQLKQGFPNTKESLGQTLLLCKVTED